MKVSEALKFMVLFRDEWDRNSKTKNAAALDVAIKSLEMQDKLKQWIENYKKPEFKDVMITRDGLIEILEEFRLECAEWKKKF